MGTLGRHLSRRCRAKARRLRSNVHAKPSHRLAKLIRSGDDARSHCSPHHPSPEAPAASRATSRTRTSGAVRPHAHRCAPRSRGAPPRLSALRRCPLKNGSLDPPRARRSSSRLSLHPDNNPGALHFAFRLPLSPCSEIPTRQKRRRPYYRARSIAPATRSSDEKLG